MAPLTTGRDHLGNGKSGVKLFRQGTGEMDGIAKIAKERGPLTVEEAMREIERIQQRVEELEAQYVGVVVEENTGKDN